MTLKTRIDRLTTLAVDQLPLIDPPSRAKGWGRFLATVLTKKHLASVCAVLRILGKYRKATTPTASFRDLPPEQLEEVQRIFTPDIGTALRNAKKYFDAHPDVLPPLPDGQYFHSFSEAERNALREKVTAWSLAQMGDNADAQ